MKRISLVGIIDDDNIYQFMIKKILQGTGQVNAIISFSNGLEAINYLIANQANIEMLPDLLFLDLEMPYMDGWQFLDSYIEIGFPKLITLYIASSSNSHDDIYKSKQFTQVKGYLTKPIKKEIIEDVITRFLVGKV
ncbi:response regulator [Dyadobacter sp. CY347]|uniref:response regulator n=1 Tax=Dyadobacter sp. CY347 TaxID=2909336 RepID=UPI001F40F0F5|nr:response regulator [Dyadobacter sp. CY347]MCF2489089.1 response regulator [Dyadobacter sp. CY347]